MAREVIETKWRGVYALFHFSLSGETGGKFLKFEQELLVHYPWLAYSRYYVVSAFCLPCLCLGMGCGKIDGNLDELF